MFKKTIFLSLLLISSFCFATEEPIVNRICSKDECYFVEKDLGNGAFGKVYAVRDSKGQRYALKSYTPPNFNGVFAEALSDAKREYEIGQILNHPNIIKSIDLFSDDTQTFYLLLELVDGERVGAQVRKSITGDQAIQLSLHLLDALKYSIDREYLYLDLHANNVMISNDFELKVVDVSSFFTFKEIKELFGTKKKLDGATADPIRKQKLQKFVQKHLARFQQMNKRRDLSNDSIVKYCFMWTFDNLVDMQLLILSKSTMDRATKIKMFTAIKQVSWNYSEDFQDGIDHPVDYYYDQVRAILENP